MSIHHATAHVSHGWEAGIIAAAATMEARQAQALRFYAHTILDALSDPNVRICTTLTFPAQPGLCGNDRWILTHPTYGRIRAADLLGAIDPHIHPQRPCSIPLAPPFAPPGTIHATMHWHPTAPTGSPKGGQLLIPLIGTLDPHGHPTHS